MKKYYESPELEIEKFSVEPSVFTASTGWGSGRDHGSMGDQGSMGDPQSFEAPGEF